MYEIIIVLWKLLFSVLETLVTTCGFVSELQVDVEEEVAKYKKYAERMRPLVTNSIAYIHKCLHSNKKVLVEGANAAMLDIDFGKWVQPYVRSGWRPHTSCTNQ